MFTSINEETYFRFKIACEEGEEDVTDAFFIGLNELEDCYCTPSTTGNRAYISGVTLTGDQGEDIDNQVTGLGANGTGYTDFSNLSVKAGASTDVDFNIEIEDNETAGLKIWVDWNRNGSFEAEEVVYASTTYLQIHIGSFQVYDQANGTYKMRIGSSYIPNNGPTDSCVHNNQGEFEDYSIEVVPLDACTEANAGNIEGDDRVVCVQEAFSLTVEGVSESAFGLVRTWQSKQAGQDEWTDLNISDFTLSMSNGITEETDYRYAATCNEGETSYSNVINVSLNPNIDECYCIPAGLDEDLYIDSFSTTGAIDNIDNEGTGFSENGYGDFTDFVITQQAGESFDFSVTIEGGTAGFRIWIDWNNDGIFDTVNEIAYSSNSYLSEHTGTILIPEDMVPGTKRMRIVSHYLSSFGNDNPCSDSHAQGEFEDYTLEVTPKDECDATMSAGVPVEDSFYLCSETGFTLEVTGSSGAANNLYRRWQSSPAGEENWTDIDDSTAAILNIDGGVTEDTDYRYAMTCNGEDSVYSDTIQVTVKPQSECYCIPTGSNNNSDEILNFSLGDFSNDSEPSEGTSGYSDYTHLGPIELIPGAEYVASITTGAGTGDHGAAIWIDYNNDGIFSADEKVVYLGNEIDGNSTVDFPAFVAGFQPGEHRLRVQYAYFRDGAALDPCSITTSYSETEDYTVLILYVDCLPPSNVSIDSVNYISAQVSWEIID